MYKNFKKHLGYYSSLIAILFLGLVLVFVASPNIELQIIITLLTIFFYILWGLFHHLTNHELTAKIVIEYMLIGALGMTIVSFFLLVSS